MSTDFTFEQQGRSLRTLLVVAGVWAALLAAWVLLDAATWIVLVLGAFTLPAIYDLIADPPAGCRLDAETLHWYSGKRAATLMHSEIEYMRFDTRLDFSVRVTAVLHTGRKIRMPFEATPPHTAFEQALEARGLRVKRFHFQLMQ